MRTGRSTVSLVRGWRRACRHEGLGDERDQHGQNQDHLETFAHDRDQRGDECRAKGSGGAGLDLGEQGFDIRDQTVNLGCKLLSFEPAAQFAA